MILGASSSSIKTASWYVQIYIYFWLHSTLWSLDSVYAVYSYFTVLHTQFPLRTKILLRNENQKQKSLLCATNTTMMTWNTVHPDRWKYCRSKWNSGYNDFHIVWFSVVFVGRNPKEVKKPENYCILLKSFKPELHFQYQDMVQSRYNKKILGLVSHFLPRTFQKNKGTYFNNLVNTH